MRLLFAVKFSPGTWQNFYQFEKTTCLHFSPVRPDRCSYEADFFCVRCTDLSSFTGCNFLRGVFVDFSASGSRFYRLERKPNFWKSSKFPHFSLTFEKIKPTLEYLILSLFNILASRNARKTGNVKILRNKKTCLKTVGPPLTLPRLDFLEFEQTGGSKQPAPPNFH